jgi:glycosyltransferase involved in cell wall biosynthesis
VEPGNNGNQFFVTNNILMNFPKLSVVTVSFNQAPYLEQTILSVLGQEYPNLEYIIIDGGSTDGSVEIIKKYESRLSYWTSEKDNGMYDGLRKGLEKSTGEIMAWINSDDIFHPKSFFVAAEIFSNFKAVEWLQGIPSVIDEQGRTVYIKDFRQWSKYNYFLEDKEHIQQESTFWRRSLWEKAGAKLDISLKLAGDYELWMRFFSHAKLYCVKTILGAFRMRAANQLSLERMGEYNAEVSAVLAARMKDLSASEKETMELLRKYLQPSSNPFARKITPEEYRAAFDFPPAFSFDRKKQSFVLES